MRTSNILYHLQRTCTNRNSKSSVTLALYKLSSVTQEYSRFKTVQIIFPYRTYNRRIHGRISWNTETTFNVVTRYIGISRQIVGQS